MDKLNIVRQVRTDSIDGHFKSVVITLILGEGRIRRLVICYTDMDPTEMRSHVVDVVIPQARVPTHYCFQSAAMQRDTMTCV